MCRGQNGGTAGQKVFTDRDCRERCSRSDTCTGYALPITVHHNGKFCYTYTSPGATGNGISWLRCYMKDIGEFGSDYRIT